MNSSVIGYASRQLAAGMDGDENEEENNATGRRW